MSRQAKIIAIGDNVVDMYLSRGKMYPGGQCLNTCVYSQMNGGKTAYLGKFGDDAAAIHNCKVIDEIGIDNSHSRHYHGENGAARVTLINGDRVFLGSNKGGVAKEHPFDFTKEDLDYIKTFDLIYTNGNSYTLQDLPLLKATGLPIAYDFSDNWDQDTLAEICPYLQIALLSCSHLNDEERTAAMKKVASYGVRLVIGTVGSKGSYALYEDHISYAQAQMVENIMDTMGAGDSYFSTLLTTLLQYDGSLFADDKEEMQRRLQIAMEKGAAFAAKVVCMEGAFGYSAPIPKQ